MTILEKLGLSKESVAKQLAKSSKPVVKPSKPTAKSFIRSRTNRKPYTESECKAVYDLWLKGKTAQNIAEITGMPDGSVWNICKRGGRTKKEFDRCHR
jgi:hypothetical protein